MSYIIFRLFTQWQVNGRENVPANGPLLIVSNHMTTADVPLITVSVGRKTVFMAKEELFRSRMSSYFYGGMGSFPVHRDRLDRKAMRMAKQALVEGWALVIFPEGTRSPDAKLQKALSGAALVAVRNDVPILPIGLVGTEKLVGAGWLLQHVNITVNIGRPFRLTSANSHLTKKELTEYTTSIMYKIAELLPEEYRGSYGIERVQ